MKIGNSIHTLLFWKELQRYRVSKMEEKNVPPDMLEFVGIFLWTLVTFISCDLILSNTLFLESFYWNMGSSFFRQTQAFDVNYPELYLVTSD